MTTLDINSAKSIVEKFDIPGKLISVEKYGNGHINDTYIIETDFENTKYILQSVNPNVFPNIEAIMDNIQKVTSHLKSKTDNRKEVMNVLETLEGKTFFKTDDGYYWRIIEFLENSFSVESTEDVEAFYECALGFGRFQRYLADFPAHTLAEIIPDFHNTPKRFEAFMQAVNEDKMGRAKDVMPEIEFIKERCSFYSVLNEENSAGNLPLRATHNDTKCNNVLLDKDTKKALCVIDLDTIMPGYSVNDFGDSIRFGASTADEDEVDLSKVNFDLEKFKVYTKGFLEGCGGLLLNSEIMLLPEGAKMMTIECGIRFLADYLNGDVYFKISRPTHNLDRCRTQLKLVSDMEKQWEDMKSCVSQYLK